MKAAFLLLVSPLVVSAAWAAEGQKYDFTTEAFRQQCHAHVLHDGGGHG